MPGIDLLGTWAFVEVALAALFFAIAAAQLGLYMQVMHQTQTVEALSHAVLPGLVLVFGLTGGVALHWLLPATLLIAWAAGALIEVVHRRWRLSVDAAVGYVFALFFSVGLVGVSLIAGDAHLDVECVLFGELALVPLQQSPVGVAWPVVQGFAVLTAVVLLEWVLGRVWQHIAFDGRHATLLLSRAHRFRLGLMLLVAAVLVVSFRSVGALVVVGFFALPVLAARVWLGIVGWQALRTTTLLFAGVSAVGGSVLAVLGNLSPSGGILTLAGSLMLAGLAYRAANR